MNEHIKKHRAEIKKQIADTFEKGHTVSPDGSIKMHKTSGEGSKGGKVIGHTKNGKAIYETHNSTTHQDFTSQEHQEAADLHRKQLKRNLTGPELRFHHNQADLHDKFAKQEHEEQAFKEGNSAERSKEIADRAVKEESDLTSQQHWNKAKELKEAGDEKGYMKHTKAGDEKFQASRKHEDRPKVSLSQYRKHLAEHGEKHGDKDLVDYSKKAGIDAIKRRWMSDNTIEKGEDDVLLEKGGEGSKGGKVIGHSKSGKAIYQNADASYHKDFSSQDHLDAVDAHLKAKKEVYNEAAKTGDTKNENVRRKINHHDKQMEAHRKLSGIEKSSGFQKSESIAPEHGATHTKEIKKQITDSYKNIEKGGKGSGRRVGAKIGTTKSGKTVKAGYAPGHKDYEDFTKTDHEDASKLHANEGDTLISDSHKDYAKDWKKLGLKK